MTQGSSSIPGHAPAPSPHPSLPRTRGREGWGQSSIRGRSRITTPPTRTRCASTPCARTIAPAAPPISPMTKPTAPPATKSAARCWRCGAPAGYPPMPASIRLPPGANGRRTCAASPSTAATTCRRRTRPRPRGHCWNSSPRARIRRMTTIDRQSAFSGTREVAERLRFDVARLEDYLSAHVAGFAGPIVVSQFKGGQSNPTYLVETPLRRYVLRRKPPGKLLPSAHAVDREHRIISALAAQRFPVAEPVLYCADDSIVGTPFFVMAHVEGRVFWEPQMPASNPTERAAVYDAMNATIARLHAFDPAAIGLADYGRGENYVARQVERWSKQYRASETQSIEDMERLIAWLPAHLPPSRPPRVVHGDYRLDNIILSPDAPQIAAVLDWELSTLGDPLADFSYHLMQWHMPPADAGTGSLIDQDIAALGIPSLETYVDAYVARTGLDPRPHLPVYFAYNFFRIAAILQGIAGRVRDGTATSAYAAAKAELVGPLAAKAWEFAVRAGA